MIAEEFCFLIILEFKVYALVLAWCKDKHIEFLAVIPVM